MGCLRRLVDQPGMNQSRASGCAQCDALGRNEQIKVLPTAPFSKQIWFVLAYGSYQQVEKLVSFDVLLVLDRPVFVITRSKLLLKGTVPHSSAFPAQFCFALRP